MPDDARRALLTRFFDHAPMFPPANLPPAEALAEDRRARESDREWMLGRLVWPAAQLSELPQDEGRALAVVGPGSEQQDDAVYLEGMPLDEVAARGLRAKIRCGGERVPSVEDLAEFIRGCRDRGLVFKATAGLHHAYPTEAGEHGFLNVLAAAVFGNEEEALRERAPAFSLDAACVPLARRGGAARAARRRARLAVPLDRDVLVLRARRGARKAGDPVSGFGAGPNGLLWRDGDEAVDLSGLGDVFAQRTLNPLMAQGRAAWTEAVAAARGHDGPRSPVSGAELRLPLEVADYVDFYSSLEHATNLGRMFRPDQEPLLPNWRWLPGRVPRPCRAASSSAARTSCGRTASGRRPTRTRRPSARAAGSTSSSSSASSSACRASSASRCRSRTSPTTSSASCSSTTGARATSRRGSTCRSARTSASRSRPRSRPG